MEENSLIEEHKGLIYLAIKENHIYWKTEDEYQDYIDAGYDGLLQGIRTYDTTKGIKPSTYYYTCIKNEMIKVITLKNRKKNSRRSLRKYCLKFLYAGCNFRKCRQYRFSLGCL